MHTYQGRHRITLALLWVRCVVTCAVCYSSTELRVYDGDNSQTPLLFEYLTTEYHLTRVRVSSCHAMDSAVGRPSLCPALRSPCLSRHQARRCWSSLCLLPRAWAASSLVSTTSPTHASACRRVCTVPALPASACARLATTALLATSGGATGGRCWWKTLEVSAPMATWWRSANCSPSRNSAGGSFSQRRSLATVRAAFTSSCSSAVCPTI